jgi:MFS family permease
MRAARWWMLGVTCLSVVVVNLDLTILNIALPAISAALRAGTSDLQWLVDAYSVVFAAVMVPAGIAGDRIGRKRLLLAGLAVFLAASLWCALSVSAGELIAARALMGLGAGIVFPLSLAVVSAAFSDDDRPASSPRRSRSPCRSGRCSAACCCSTSRGIRCSGSTCPLPA